MFFNIYVSIYRNENKNKNKSKLKIITANIYQELNEVKFNNESANLVKIKEIDNTLRELSLSQYLDQCDIEKWNKNNKIRPCQFV